MAVAYNPGIVTDGLVLCLDAANRKSYPGTGTDWTDISSRNNSGTLLNGPVFSSQNSGYFLFDGANDRVNLTASSDFDFGTGNLTIDCWVFWGGTYTGTGRSIYSTGGSGSLDQIGIFEGLGVYFGGVYNNVAANYLPTNQWAHLIGTRVGTTIKIYINGVETASGTQASSIGSSVTNPTIGIRTDNNHPWSGRIAFINIYKGKGFSQQEVLQNFNALRGRFGI